MIKFFFKFIRTTKFRLFSFLFVFGLIALTVIYQNVQYISQDPIPKIEQVDAKTQKLATNISVGCHIFNFPEFSFEKKSFIIDAIIWFKFPASSTDLSCIDQFTIQSSFMQENGELQYRSAPIINRLNSDVVVSYHVQTSFTSVFNFKYFPISDHTLNIIIQNRNVTPEEICFNTSSDNFLFCQNMFNSWVVKDTKVSTGFMRSKLLLSNPVLDVTYPVAIFSINFEQKGFNNLFSLYFPLFVIFFIALFSLFFEIDDTQRIANIVAIAPSLVLFKLIISSIAPDVAYLTHIDYMFYGLVFLSTCILLFQMYATLLLQSVKKLPEGEQESLKEALRRKNDLLFIFNIFFLIFLISWCTFK
jgi:hypothetical protein